MFFNLFEIFLLGLIGGAVPGPILTSSFTEVLRGGFRGGMKVILQALFVETGVALIILLGVSALNLPEKYFHGISLLGAGVLIWLAYQVWKIREISGGEGTVFTFPKIVLLTVLNGGFWIFWITICVPRAFLLSESVPGGQFLFVAIFELGWLVSTVALVGIFLQFRPLLLRKNLVGTTFKFFSVVLALFAIKSIVESVVFFF